MNGKCILGRLFYSNCFLQKHFRQCYNLLHASYGTSSLYEYACEKARDIAIIGLHVIPDFITLEEEKAFMSEVEPKWGKLAYQPGHWDNAIQLYRELEVSSWSDENTKVLSKLCSYAFGPTDRVRRMTHVLDLSPDGYIKPHVDSKKFCGSSIAGLSLMSPSIMKFCDEENSNIWFKVLLPQRSLYVMKDKVRYEFTHEILKTEESYINEVFIPKQRRISVICRTEPTEEVQTQSDIFKVIPISLDET